MLIDQHGSVVPHVNPGTASDHTITHLNARYVRHGAKLNDLLVDCWSRGLSAYQTINICSVNGYALCIAETARRRVWANWDAGWQAHCKEFEDLSDKDKACIEFPTQFTFVNPA